MAISHCYLHSGQKWQLADLSPRYWHVVVKNGNFTLLLTYSGQEWHFHIAIDILWSKMAISHCYWHLLVRNGHFNCYGHLVVKNGNFTLLLTSGGQELQFHIATDILWSRMAISHSYWHLVVKNCNFTLLLIFCGQEWQLADLPADIPLQMHHGIYIKGCIWQPFWILQEKGGNFLLFLNN